MAKNSWPGAYQWLILQAIRCQTEAGETWIVGDAILDRDWLTAWMFYWPNRYVAEEIIRTWRSVGTILASADVVVPGHGAALVVDDGLLELLLDRFPQAMLAQQCPDVQGVLNRRLQSMLGRNRRCKPRTNSDPRAFPPLPFCTRFAITKRPRRNNLNKL